jgi:hypothetical protein
MLHRQLATVFARIEVETGRIGDADLAAEEAEFDRKIGLDQALAALASMRSKPSARASGGAAHYREAEDLARRAREVGNQIRNTKPVTLTGAIAMLKWGHESGCCDEHPQGDKKIEDLIVGDLHLKQRSDRQPSRHAVSSLLQTLN